MTKTGRPRGIAKVADLSNPWAKFRTWAGMSQRELGEILEIAQSTIANFESGRKFPYPWTAKRFVTLCRARKFRMSMDDVYEKMSID